MKKKKTKALVLLSGGLDSILAAKILQEQGVEVTGLTFVSCFFNHQAAQKAAEKLNIDLKIIDFSDEHLAFVKNPKYGRGKAMNPCIDCHLLMIKKAGQVMAQQGYDLVATGEVLGERPMSQNRRALELISERSGIGDYLLRPLSAKELEPILVEQRGLVNRAKLEDISGRSRKRQMELAKKWGIVNYPTPAGGCLLTEVDYGKKLKAMLDKWEDAECDDIRLLRSGRIFWQGNNLIVVGRNKEDNDTLKKIKQRGDLFIEPTEFKGPSVIVRSKGEISDKALVKARDLILKYSKKNQPINS